MTGGAGPLPLPAGSGRCGPVVGGVAAQGFRPFLNGTEGRKKEQDMLKQRQRMSAGPPTLIDQQPHVLYTMSPQTVERLEDVLRKTLAL